MLVGVAGLDADGFAHLGLGQGEGGVGGAADVGASCQPLVGYRASATGWNAVDVGQCVCSGQHLALGGCAGDGDIARGGVVDVGDSCSCIAGHALGRSQHVGIAGLHADGLAHLRLSQREGGARGSTDVDTIGQPLVSHRAHATGGNAIEVGQSVSKVQHLALGACAGDGEIACGQIVDVDQQRVDRADEIGFKKSSNIVRDQCRFHHWAERGDADRRVGVVLEQQGAELGGLTGDRVRLDDLQNLELVVGGGRAESRGVGTGSNGLFADHQLHGFGGQAGGGTGKAGCFGHTNVGVDRVRGASHKDAGDTACGLGFQTHPQRVDQRAQHQLHAHDLA